VPLTLRLVSSGSSSPALRTDFVAGHSVDGKWVCGRFVPPLRWFVLQLTVVVLFKRYADCSRVSSGARPLSVSAQVRRIGQFATGARAARCRSGGAQYGVLDVVARGACEEALRKGLFQLDDDAFSQEPVIYVAGRPHVLRLVDRPLQNVELRAFLDDSGT
jgi:hypothetical protein